MTVRPLLLVALLLSTSLAAQSSLQGPFHAYGASITRTLAGDVSGDGLEDLVLLSEAQLPQLVLAAPGQDFGGAQTIAAAPWIPRRAALGDLDGDGLAELVLLHANQVHVAVLRATGGGSFAAPQSLFLPDQATGVALLDTDADGRRDLVFGRRGDPLALVLHNDGALQFTPAADLAAQSGAVELRLADVTGDGLPDLLSSDADPELAGTAIALAPGLGAGAYGPAQSFPAPGILRIAVGDLDGDAAADVAWATDEDELHLQDGGPFGLGPDSPAPLDRGVGGLAVADMDRDGLLDLVVALRDAKLVQETGLVLVWLQEPGAHFAEPRLWAGAPDPFELLAADFDHDGGTDLLLLGDEGHTLLRGQGDGLCRNALGLQTWPEHLEIGDADGDGALDVLVGELGFDDVVRIFPSRPVAGFGPRIDVPLDHTLRALGVGDFTGDGVPDLVSGGVAPGDSWTAITPGLGDGAFGAPMVSEIGINVSDLVVGDLDADGDLDLVTEGGSGFPANRLNVGLNDGAGLLTKVFGLNITNSPQSLNLADVTGDGRLDLGVMFFDDWFRQFVLQPDGSLVLAYSEHFNSNTGTNVSAAYDDFDGDGLLDVLFGTSQSPIHRVRVLRGLGDGTYALLGEQVAPAFTNQFTLTDLDGDDIEDLALLGDGELVAWSRLPGAGSGPWFGADVGQPLFGHADELAAGDLDGDGAPELLTRHQDHSAVHVWRNLRGPWKDLGHSLAHSGGFSRLAGSGTLQPGSPTLLLVEHAAPRTPAILVVGLSQIDLPFKGGVLVPQPGLLLVGLATDANGELLLETPWPAGLPSDLSLVLQAWLGVPGAGEGLSATNGLSATTP